MNRGLEERCRVCGAPIATAELCVRCAEGNDPFGPRDPNGGAQDGSRRATELTPEGEQFVIPGCERPRLPARGQGSLF